MPRISDLGIPGPALGQRVEAVVGLRQLPLFERLVLGAPFKREKMYFADDVTWFDRRWEVRLSAVDNVIYKVALEARARAPHDRPSHGSTPFRAR